MQSGEEKKLRKRVFNILVECLQNIVNHGDVSVKNKKEVASLLLLGRTDSDIFIITGNRILNSKIPSLEAKIKEINAWEHEDMRDIYSDRLGKSTYSEKGGAGLGLLDIYKRSGNKLEYSLARIDDEVSFLSLHIKVKSETD